MADNQSLLPLPADLPTNWVYGQTVAPSGAEVGLTKQHGYNYLMEQVNATQQAVNVLGEGTGELQSQVDTLEESAGALQSQMGTLEQATGELQGQVGGLVAGQGVVAKANTLATARTIALSGGATGTATAFDGSKNVSIPVTGLNMNNANAGTLAVGRGGTGATAKAGARTNLGVSVQSGAPGSPAAGDLWLW